MKSQHPPTPPFCYFFFFLLLNTVKSDIDFIPGSAAHDQNYICHGQNGTCTNSFHTAQYAMPVELQGRGQINKQPNYYETCSYRESKALIVVQKPQLPHVSMGK